jgi:hypothetical protein
MPLECSCDDFRKCDHDYWYEGWSLGAPASNSRCCECGALVSKIPDYVQSILEYETYIPEGYDYEKNHDEFVESDEHGKNYDHDCERFERWVHTHFRCERCTDIAEAIQSLGYCEILPGDLIDSYSEYLELNDLKPVKWVVDYDGVLHPMKFTKFDYFMKGLDEKINRIKFEFKYKFSMFRIRVKSWLIKYGIMRRKKS